MWSEISESYGNAKDLEEKQRILLSNFLRKKNINALELACWNGKILEKISQDNPSAILTWVDYNSEMIKSAREKVPHISLKVWDITKLSDIFKDDVFDAIFCVNSLHNLPHPKYIYSLLEKVWGYIAQDGYFIFDIRNSWNPFIRYGYYKNRKKWLSFWTLNYFRVIRFAKKNDFIVHCCRWIYYKNREESFFNSRFKTINFLYTLYISITKITLFSPYVFIILQKK